jgi:hypothetical protein
MKTYGGSKVIAPPFLTSALGSGEWSASRSACFTHEERVTGTHWRGGLAGPELVRTFWRRVKFFALAENLTPTVQTVALLCTD